MSTKVLIGIQARSGSTRLPRKAFELISGRPMLDRVIDSCASALKYATPKLKIDGRVAVLTPEGDPIAGAFRGYCDIVEGPAFDVLGRYRVAVEKYDPEYIVRITGDCPLIKPNTINSLLSMALKNRYDYVSNVDERFRTAIDGHDCEVIGRKLFDYVADNATEPSDREHVTTFVRRCPPSWAVMGLVMEAHDQSSIKLSVDTVEDLDRVRKAFDDGFSKYQGAIRVYGRGRVHRV